MKHRGTFITLEGPEGSGKTTQSERLVDRLKQSGCEVVATREPGGTPLGEKIRGILKANGSDCAIGVQAEILLFEASRAELVGQVINPALESGKCVVCDRYTDSTTAYQGHGRGFDVEVLLRLNEIATGGLCPDITILIDVDFDSGFGRLEKRAQTRRSGMDRLEMAGREFHERVRRGYLEIARQWPDRIVVVDGTGGAAEVERLIWNVVVDRMKLKHES